MKTNYQKMEYLSKVQKAVEKVYFAMYGLEELWEEESKYEIDLNEFLSEDFPFKLSFDEQLTIVKNWMATAMLNLKKEIDKLNL